VAEVQQDVIVHNALVRNALVRNALVRNALIRNALIRNDLTSSALMGNSLTRDALRDAESRQLFSFIVSCALPEDESVDVKVDGVPYHFPGELGLAPEWGKKHGSCGESCQEWVSACLLARVNYKGEHVMISLRGKNEALLSTKKERARYDVPEATYYGNVFLEEQRRFACLAPGKSSIPRVCGPSLKDCVVDVVGGDCEEVCDKMRPDGSFTNCRDREPFELQCGAPVFPRGTDSYKASVSVFLE
jgi:hypothetical protein